MFSEELCKRFAENTRVDVVVEGLVKIGVNPIMVNWRTSQAIAKEVGITYGRVEVIPTGRADAILSFQKGGKIVEEMEINVMLIQPGDAFKVILDSKMPVVEYVVENQIGEDENGSPVDEKKIFEKELR